MRHEAQCEAWEPVGNSGSAAVMGAGHVFSFLLNLLLSNKGAGHGRWVRMVGRWSDPRVGEWRGAVVQGRGFWKRRVNFDRKAGSLGGGGGTQPGSSAHSVPGILLQSSHSVVMAVLQVGLVSPF